MPPRRSKGFFQAPPREEDAAARQREVAALLAPRRTLVQDVPAERIRPNPFQARIAFTGLEDLRDVILAQGFTSRLRVRPDPSEAGFFQLVYGERRLRAARLAGLDTLPCEIAEHSDDELLEIGLAENIQRQDLNPLEEARAFATFMSERGYSLRRLAERIGKDKGYLENRLALLHAPADVQDMVAQRPDSLVAARAIARLATAAERAPLIAQVLAGELPTLAVREAVRELNQASSVPASPSVPSLPSERTIAQRVQRDLATMRAILERWMLLAEAADTQELLAPALNEVVDLAEHVAQAIQDRPHTL